MQMPTTFRYFTVAGLVLLAALGCSSTVFVVRHAEPDYVTRCDPARPQDPCLSDEGRDRARELVHVLEKADVTAVYSTHCKRTMETAQPLADFLTESLARPVEIQQFCTDCNPNCDVGCTANCDLNDLIPRLIAAPDGARSLVVAHSGMVEAIVERLGGDRRDCPIMGDFDNLCVVTRRRPGDTRVINLQYGADGMPDLVVCSLTHMPAEPRAGQPITFTVRVENIGRVRADASTLSLRVGDQDPESFPVPPLDPGTGHEVQLVRALPAGGHEIVAVADAENDVLESAEANNRRTLLVSVADGLLPDLVVESLTVDPPEPGTSEYFWCTAVVKNVGQGAAVPTKLSLQIDGYAAQLYDVPALAPGETSSERRKAKVLQPGHYRNKAIADALNDEFESSEQNNKRIGEFSVICTVQCCSDQDCRFPPNRKCCLPGLPESRCIGVDEVCPL